MDTNIELQLLTFSNIKLKQIGQSPLLYAIIKVYKIFDKISSPIVYKCTHWIIIKSIKSSAMIKNSISINTENIYLHILKVF